MHTTSHFDQLLRAAAEQPEPQRLLFVFATAELPDDATSAQRERFAAGGGGTLSPVRCVDKAVEELASFDQLVAESLDVGPPWQVVFAAGLSGRAGQSPSGDAVESALEKMVERVKSGMIDGLLALNPSGEVLHFV